MILRPKFKSHFHIKLVPPDLVFFIGESGYKVLRGNLLYHLIPHIDGNRSIPEIAKRVKRQFDLFDVQCGISLLEGEGVIHDAASTAPSAVDILRDSLNMDAKFFDRRLKTRPVDVLSFGNLSPVGFLIALQQLGVRTQKKAFLTIALADDYLQPELESFHREAMLRKQLWMIVKPTGTIIWIGPVFNPPQYACWACLSRRLKMNREADAFVRAYASETDTSHAMPLVPSIQEVALNLAAVEVLKWLTATDHPRSEILTLDLRTTTMERHSVSRLPDCPDCGAKSKRQSRIFPRPVSLKRCDTIFTHDGGHRAAAAEATYEKYSHHISPITGIVDRVELSYSDNRGLIHAYVAGHLFVPPDPADLLSRGLKQLSAGKGMTPQQARTGALCEALERYSGVFRGSEFRIAATYAELEREAVHPRELLQYSDAQYATRNSSKEAIPARFDQRKRIDWSPAWSLTHRRYKYIPAAYCYYGFPAPTDHDFCRVDSNGNAAGNTLEEAIFQGFLELVERDSAALWWYNRIPKPAVNLESFGKPYFQAMQDYYRSLHLKLWVLDITADFPIPAFAAVSTSTRSGRPQFLIGLGAHFDATVALSRALTETNQFLRTYLSGGSKHIVTPSGKELSYLYPSPATPRTMEDFPHFTGGDLRENVLQCVELAKDRGLETLILDQTRPDVGLPVVKVIVPGMRPLWPRFAPGRLYDVPVGLGWIKKPLLEKQLNPDRIVI